jgi:spore coat protein U-like protein
VFQIPVTASVGGTCGFTTAPNANLFHANIDTTGWSDQVPFTVECTAPWRIAVSSQNGALKNAATVAAGYQNKAPYTVSLNVSSDGGTVTAACPVAEIDQAVGSSPCSFKGTAAPSAGLVIPRSFGLAGSYIQVAAPAYTGPDLLVSGTYNDTLVVTISPAS